MALEDHTHESASGQGGQYLKGLVSLGVGTTSPAYQIHAKVTSGECDIVADYNGTAKAVLAAGSGLGSGAGGVGTITNTEFWFVVSNSAKWRITTGGHLEPFSNDSYNIGSDSYRPAKTYLRELRCAGGTYYLVNPPGGSGAAVHIDGVGRIMYLSSNARYKKNIANMKQISIDALKKLRVVNFTWNEKSACKGKKDFGLIANEVAKVLPMLVNYDKNKKPDSVRYELLSVLLLKTLQETLWKNEEKSNGSKKSSANKRDRKK